MCVSVSVDCMYVQSTVGDQQMHEKGQTDVSGPIDASNGMYVPTLQT